MKKRIYTPNPMYDPSRLLFASNVDIIIPFHGQYSRVVKLIESIYQYTRSNWYRVCLVDDCSSNGSEHELEDDKKEGLIHLLSKFKSKPNMPEIKCIRSNEPIGFGAACNLGYMHTNYPWVIFINSDCEIKDINWLKNLGASILALKSSGVKMIAPKTNNCVGGDDRMELDRDDFMKEAKNGEFNKNVVLENDYYFPLYCFMCHRELFQRLGGGLKQYKYGWGEDEEMTYRMKKYGYKQAICGSSWIYHYGEATIRELWRKDQKIRNIMENNIKSSRSEIEGRVKEKIV